LRGCYVGFGRGGATELLYLVGIVSVTALASNYYGPLAGVIGPWWRFDPQLLQSVCFLLLLCIGLLIVHRALHQLAPLILRERLAHWLMQGSGLIFGGLRGAWWCGVVLLWLLSLSLPYFAASIHERSLLGSRFITVSTNSVRWVAEHFPGHHRRVELLPTMKVTLPTLPL